MDCGLVVRLSGVVEQSIVDGPGLRMTVFTQGCGHGCPGCHNPGTHSFDGGFDCSLESLMATFDENPILAGITLSGGEPLAQAGRLAPLAREVKARGKNVWCYTGYTFEEILHDPTLDVLLRHVDVLVDGRYVQSKRSLELRYRGSANQRVLDLPESLEKGMPVPYRDKTSYSARYA